jgi:hypothetical protein
MIKATFGSPRGMPENWGGPIPAGFGNDTPLQKVSGTLVRAAAKPADISSHGRRQSSVMQPSSASSQLSRQMHNAYTAGLKFLLGDED